MLFFFEKLSQGIVRFFISPLNKKAGNQPAS
jgi:hypothetical protein